MNEDTTFAVSAAESVFDMIETKHPGGKRGIQIPENIYENIRNNPWMMPLHLLRLHTKTFVV